MSATSSSQVSEAAKRYASALFDLAKDSSAVESTEKDMLALADTIRENTDLTHVVRSPAFSSEDKSKALVAIIDKMGLGDLVKRFVGVVTLNGRTSDLVDIATVFRDLSAKHRGVTRASVVSAHELSADQVKQLESLVAGTTSGEVTMDVSVDPALISGFQLRLGSKLIDVSARSTLDKMNLAMKGA